MEFCLEFDAVFQQASSHWFNCEWQLIPK